MPIRQERIITLINAAVEYRSLSILCSTWLHDRALKDMDRDQLLLQIESWAGQLNYALIQKASQYEPTITMEYHNFRRNRIRNERYKIKEQIKRRNAGVQQRAQPKNLGEQNRLQVTEILTDPTAASSVTTAYRYISSTEEDAELNASYTAEMEKRANMSEKEREKFDEEQRQRQEKYEVEEEEPDPFFKKDGTPIPLDMDAINAEPEEESVTDPIQLGFGDKQ